MAPVGEQLLLALLGMQVDAADHQSPAVVGGLGQLADAGLGVVGDRPPGRLGNRSDSLCDALVDRHRDRVEAPLCARGRRSPTSSIDGSISRPSAPCAKTMKSSSLPAVTSPLPHDPIKTTNTSVLCRRSARQHVSSPGQPRSAPVPQTGWESLDPLLLPTSSPEPRQPFPLDLGQIHIRGRLEDPGHVQAALQDRAEQLLVLVGQRNVVKVVGERAEVDVAQASAEAVE